MHSALDKISIVLVEPSHPGNIGSVARAMKTMGLSDLVLVNPKKFPHSEATKLSAGAESVLEQARVVESLEQAISDCTLVMGTSVRDREVGWPTANPSLSAAEMVDHLEQASEHQVAILFGRESSGLSNQEMDCCHSQIRIDANIEYSSLNLASAVQIISYELRMKSAASQVFNSVERVSQVPTTPAQERQRLATQAELNGHLEHLQNTLLALNFSKSKKPTLLMRKLTRLYNKARLTLEEIQILRGILTAYSDKVSFERGKRDTADKD
ncbi:MAG: TrmH family RNA methyltransferase [Cryomorphaceae bacterium]